MTIIITDGDLGKKVKRKFIILAIQKQIVVVKNHCIIIKQNKILLLSLQKKKQLRDAFAFGNHFHEQKNS